MACKGYACPWTVDRCNKKVQSAESASQMLLRHTHSAVSHTLHVNLGNPVTKKQARCAWMMESCDVTPVVRPNKAVAVVQHHAIQVFVLCVEPHLDVTSEVRVALWSVGLLQLVTQQAGHTLHLHLLLSDEDLHSTFSIAFLMPEFLPAILCKACSRSNSCRRNVQSVTVT